MYIFNRLKKIKEALNSVHTYYGCSEIWSQSGNQTFPNFGVPKSKKMAFRFRKPDFHSGIPNTFTTYTFLRVCPGITFQLMHRFCWIFWHFIEDISMIIEKTRKSIIFSTCLLNFLRDRQPQWHIIFQNDYTKQSYLPIDLLLDFKKYTTSWRLKIDFSKVNCIQKYRKKSKK